MTAFAILLDSAKLFRGNDSSYFVTLVIYLIQRIELRFKFVEVLLAGARIVVSELVHGVLVVSFAIPDRLCQLVDEVGYPVIISSAFLEEITVPFSVHSRTAIRSLMVQIAALSVC